MKVTVYLYRAPECTRGWLSYLKTNTKPTLEVEVEAETRTKAKNVAITIANRDFAALKIIWVNREEGSFYSVKNFPDIEKLLSSNKQ